MSSEIHDHEPRLLLGLRCWPQWRGWGVCPLTGDLVDPNGQAYGPDSIAAAAWLLSLRDLRDRLIFADGPVSVPALSSSDLGTADRPLRELRERARLLESETEPPWAQGQALTGAHGTDHRLAL